MKQHISANQLKQLDFKEQMKIATLFGEYGNCSRNDSKGDEYFNLGLLSERITIGRMIEVLALDNIVVNIKATLMDTKDELQGFVLLDNTFYHKDFSAKELCDALWNAIITTFK